MALMIPLRETVYLACFAVACIRFVGHLHVAGVQHLAKTLHAENIGGPSTISFSDQGFTAGRKSSVAQPG